LQSEAKKEAQRVAETRKQQSMKQKREKRAAGAAQRVAVRAAAAKEAEEQEQMTWEEHSVVFAKQVLAQQTAETVAERTEAEAEQERRRKLDDSLHSWRIQRASAASSRIQRAFDGRSESPEESADEEQRAADEAAERAEDAEEIAQRAQRARRDDRVDMQRRARSAVRAEEAAEDRVEEEVEREEEEEKEGEQEEEEEGSREEEHAVPDTDVVIGPEGESSHLSAHIALLPLLPATPAQAAALAAAASEGLPRPISCEDEGLDAGTSHFLRECRLEQYASLFAEHGFKYWDTVVAHLSDALLVPSFTVS
jgi:hypothetical protein